MILADLSFSTLLPLALALIIAGACSGVLAGLFGVGGGAVMVPVLDQVFGLIGVPDEIRMHLSVGTSLAVIVPTSIRSFRSHLARDAVDRDILKLWAVPIVVGVGAGSLIAAFVSSDVLRLVFAIIAGLTGLKLLLARDDWRLGASLPGRGPMMGFGFANGVFSALMGVGGGIIGNMVMTLYNVPIHRSVATSSGFGILISIPGVLGYMIAGWPHQALLPPLSLGYISLIGAALLMPFSILAAPLGVRLAHGFSKRRLEIAFGAFLLIVAARFVWAFMH